MAAFTTMALLGLGGALAGGLLHKKKTAPVVAPGPTTGVANPLPTLPTLAAAAPIAPPTPPDATKAQATGVKAATLAATKQRRKAMGSGTILGGSTAPMATATVKPQTLLGSY